jgi:hypothetical protein
MSVDILFPFPGQALPELARTVLEAIHPGVD